MEKLIDDANKNIIMLFKKEYGKYNDIIESYIRDNNLISTFDKSYHIYCDNALKHSNNLSNSISIETNYVEMKTNIPYKQFTIIVNTYLLCIIYSFGKFRNKPIIDILSRSTIPFELLLINKYQDAYYIENQPYDDINDLNELVQELYDGGYNDKQILYSNNITDNNVIIGYNALKLLGIKVKHNNRLQIITDNIDETLEKIKETYSSANIKELDTMTHDVRLKKYTAYIENKPIIDIYNSGSYELIPYKKIDNIMVAHPYVICRFLMIDYWITILLETPDDRIKDVIKTLMNINNVQYTQYYGVHEDKNIALKKLYKDTDFFSYFPYKHYKQNGSYRIIK